VRLLTPIRPIRTTPRVSLDVNLDKRTQEGNFNQTQHLSNFVGSNLNLPTSNPHRVQIERALFTSSTTEGTSGTVRLNDVVNSQHLQSKHSKAVEGLVQKLQKHQKSSKDSYPH
jgi:hypothetical protein